MQLRKWLKDNGVTMAEFGRRIGRTEATVSRIARGKHVPTFDVIERIETETGCAVTRADFSSPQSSAA